MSIEYQLSCIKRTLPEHVRLIAVSKTHPVEVIQRVYDAGQRLFGENRPQELKAKFDVLPKDIEWHMIGHLQTNKVKYVVPLVAMIHSVDSARLAEAIQKEASRCERRIDILLEIHVADEMTKSGWEFGELLQYVRSLALNQMPHIRVRGVMGIATNTEDQARIRHDFQTLKHHFDTLKPFFGTAFDTISMGMSHDYPLAVECGANMVRVGSLIFGERDYTQKEAVL